MSGPGLPAHVRSPASYRLAGLLAGLLAVLGPGVVEAHGPVAVGPPDPGGLILGWSIEPIVAIPLVAAALCWRWAVDRVNRAHPAKPVPRLRSWAFYGGLFAIAVALMSGIERYDTVLFSVHMVQHILLTLVAAPLIALGAPITLLLRLAPPDARRRWLLPLLHSRAVRAVTFPIVATLLFTAVMWGSHFSPLFDEALENPLLHDLEHVAYLVTALLFWWPAIGLDPSPWRMSHPVRALYTFLQMPQNTFLAVAILSAGAPLYRHYATLVRSWGPTPLEDQQAAGGIMWLLGDLIFLGAILLIVLGWMRAEERRTARSDRRADAALAAIREREARLAARLGEAGDEGARGAERT